MCKKRARTPSQMVVAENSTKRQRLVSKQLGGVSLTELRKKESENSKAVSKLTLENQRLRLESKHRMELHELEKDALKNATELRTMNRLLQQEVSRLEKENKTLRLRREYRKGLGKYEVERRLKTFPWLQNYARMETNQAQSTQGAEARMEWKDLPVVIAISILKCLSDEDLFVLRGLSTQFYEAFYAQDVNVDCERCMWLAKRGRKFVNLKFMNAFDDFTWKEFRVLGPSHFPKLEVLWLENSSPRLMKAHPNLKELQFTSHDYEDLQCVSDSNFPALEVFILFMEDEIFEDNPNRLRHFSGHKMLIHIGFAFCDPTLTEIMELTKAKFPRLRAVGITGEVVPEVFHYLEEQGIDFTDSIKKLSFNPSNFRA